MSYIGVMTNKATVRMPSPTNDAATPLDCHFVNARSLGQEASFTQVVKIRPVVG
jgi:hypothetical protein